MFWRARHGCLLARRSDSARRSLHCDEWPPRFSRMLRAGVTIGCAAAMVVAAVLAVRLRHTRRTPSPLSGSEPFGERLAVTVCRAGGMLIGAYLAGVLTIGAGGRLMMRVLAATSSDDVQGLRTEADEIIGEV